MNGGQGKTQRTKAWHTARLEIHLPLVEPPSLPSLRNIRSALSLSILNSSNRLASPFLSSSFASILVLKSLCRGPPPNIDSTLYFLENSLGGRKTLPGPCAYNSIDNAVCDAPWWNGDRVGAMKAAVDENDTNERKTIDSVLILTFKSSDGARKQRYQEWEPWSTARTRWTKDKACQGNLFHVQK